MRPQRQFQNPALGKEIMRQPTLREILPIQLRTLDVDILIPSIEVDRSDGRSVTRMRVSDVDLREEGRDDEINILPAHGVETHHGKSGKRAHGAGVVIAGDTVEGVVEGAGDILVGVLGRETRAAGEVEEEEEKI